MYTKQTSTVIICIAITITVQSFAWPNNEKSLIVESMQTNEPRVSISDSVIDALVSGRQIDYPDTNSSEFPPFQNKQASSISEIAIVALNQPTIIQPLTGDETIVSNGAHLKNSGIKNLIKSVIDRQEYQDPQTANTDQTVIVAVNQPAIIQPLPHGNQINSGSSVKIESISEASVGSATIQTDNTVLYSPDPDYTGVDTFSYQLTNEMGEKSMGEVIVSVEDITLCSYTVNLNWSDPDDKNIAGFYIYHGLESGLYDKKEFVGYVYNYDFCVNTPGQHYFAASTKSTKGEESELTTEITAVIEDVE